MAEQARNGMKSGRGFKNKALTAAVKAINNEFPDVQVSESNVSNHIRTLKNKWSQIKKLKDMSGNGWDDNEKKIIVDETEYRTYVQAHPKKEPFINKAIEMFEEMLLVFGGEAATGMHGKSAYSVSRLGIPMNAPSIPIPNDINDVGLENFDFFGTENNVMGDGSPPETQNVNSTPTRPDSIATKNASKKRKREEDIQLAVSEVAKGITRLADAFDKDKDIESMVLDAVMPMEGKFPIHVLILASDYLADNKNIARVFLKRTPSYQEAWVASFANGYITRKNVGGNGLVVTKNLK
ncbi:hypothetical protein LUZ60_008840 [Juncus effusus]|nr:hypothetical protein LUZ60_008840 [Juncus effusus]